MQITQLAVGIDDEFDPWTCTNDKQLASHILIYMRTWLPSTRSVTPPRDPDGGAADTEASCSINATATASRIKRAVVAIVRCQVRVPWRTCKTDEQHAIDTVMPRVDSTYRSYVAHGLHILVLRPGRRTSAGPNRTAIPFNLSL